VESGIDFTLSGDLGGSGGLTKEGPGTLVLEGNDSDFSGGLTVDAGTVSVNEANELTIGSDVAGQNLLGTGDIATNTGGTLDVTITGANDINVGGGVTITNAGGTTNLTGGDDFFLGNGGTSGSLVNTAGTTTITVSDDFSVDDGSSINVSGGTMNLNPAATFATTGSGANPATIDVTNGGTLNIDLTAGGGTGNSFDLGVNDTFSIDGGTSSATISAETGTTVNLDGIVSLTNEGVLTINSGTTQLDGNTRIQGGSPSSAGTIRIEDGSLSVDEPLLSNKPNFVMDVSGSEDLTAPNANSSLTGVGTFEKAGAGDVTLQTNLNNIQADTLIITEGSIINAADNQIDNSTDLELAGGTWNTGGFDEIVDTLTLSADSTIDMANGDSIIQFSDSSALGWDGGSTLIIDNWSGNTSVGGGTDQLIFSSAGLTETQLGQVFFRDPFGPGSGLYEARFIGDELVPVPEPSTYIGGALLILAAGFFEWRRRRGKK
jgi:autotransporter-associated beta strand protein